MLARFGSICGLGFWGNWFRTAFSGDETKHYEFFAKLVGTAKLNDRSTLVNSQITNILNQITNDIDNIRTYAGTLAESNSIIQEGIQDVKDVADRAYMLAVIAIPILSDPTVYGG
jgi:hypothetical protein